VGWEVMAVIIGAWLRPPALEPGHRCGLTFLNPRVYSWWAGLNPD
jgi:hypothetical protein